MFRIFLCVSIIYLLVPHDVTSAHRTAASRHKTVQESGKSKTSSMRSRMMEVLHLRDDKSLTSMFNMDDEDPAYVFVLPDKRNKTIVFHQRDFLAMNYPKISEVGRMEGPVFYEPLNATEFRDVVRKNKTGVPIAQRLTVRDSDEVDDFLSSSAEEEAEMDRIVGENVRTERNFIQFMEDLNDKPRAEKSSKSLKHPRATSATPAQHPQAAAPTQSALRFQHFGDRFHLDLFHNPQRQRNKLAETIQPPPPTSKYHRQQHSEDYEEDEDDEGEEGEEGEVDDYRGKKVKQKPGYGNIGEVVSPPFHEDSADRSDEFISELKIVPKLKNSKSKRKLPPRRKAVQTPTPPAAPGNLHRPKLGHSPSHIYESRKIETGGGNPGWDDLGLDGWSGGLSDPVDEFEEKVEPPANTDIFHEGITYNRMKEMFHKNPVHQVYHLEEEEEEEQHPSYYQSTRDIAKPSTSDSGSSWGTTFNKPRVPPPPPPPVTHLKSQYEYSEEAEEADEEDGYRFNPHQGHGHESIQESNEYVQTPRTRTKYKTQASHYDVTEETQEYVESDEERFAEEEAQDAYEDGSEEEFVYMINGKPISLELAELLRNEHTTLNFTRQVKRPPSSSYHHKWHLTSSRSAHRDSDVFVARANNPFGHSTKWEWNNASSSYVIPTKKHRKRGGRSKRGVAELYSMVKCATGCDPLVYKGYGCYCGFLGQGKPLDGIDKCCKQHDNCYSHSRCPSYLEYFVPYLWKCWKGQPLCAVSHGEWGDADSCAARLCQCDLKLSMCLRRYYCPRSRNVCTGSPWRLLQNFIMDF